VWAFIQALLAAMFSMVLVAKAATSQHKDQLVQHMVVVVVVAAAVVLDDLALKAKLLL
jgi:hypothetical protein